MRDRPQHTAIVYGGSGFLGSHVADVLSENGYAVKLYDRNPSPYLRDGQEIPLHSLGEVLRHTLAVAVHVT